jgi:hypothetical protein
MRALLALAVVAALPFSAGAQESGNGMLWIGTFRDGDSEKCGITERALKDAARPMLRKHNVKEGWRPTAPYLSIKSYSIYLRGTESCSYFTRISIEYNKSPEPRSPFQATLSEVIVLCQHGILGHEPLSRVVDRVASGVSLWTDLCLGETTYK